MKGFDRYIFTYDDFALDFAKEKNKPVLVYVEYEFRHDRLPVYILYPDGRKSEPMPQHEAITLAEAQYIAFYQEDE